MSPKQLTIGWKIQPDDITEDAYGNALHYDPAETETRETLSHVAEVLTRQITDALVDIYGVERT